MEFAAPNGGSFAFVALDVGGCRDAAGGLTADLGARPAARAREGRHWAGGCH
jgi:hypothetical protein